MAEMIRRGRIREPKVVPMRDGQWTPLARGRFLDHLSQTCNVRAACRAAGRHHTGAYALRRRDAGFAAQWQAALEAGYDVLEAALLEHVLAPLYPDETLAGETVVGKDGDVATGAPFDPELALKLLNRHRGPQGPGTRQVRGGGPTPRYADPAETDAAILAALARLDARRRAS